MKILYISPIYFEDVEEIKKIHVLGGGGRYPFELAKNVLKTGKDEVEIIFFGRTKSNFTIDGIRVSVIQAIKFLPKFNGYANPLPLSLDFFKKIKQADVIHGIQIRTEAIMLAIIYSKIIGKPMFVTDNGFGGASLAMLFPFETLAAGVMAISKDDYGYWKSKNKHIIYGGVDMKKFEYKKSKQKYILYAGRLVSHKGIEVLIKALPKKYRAIIAGNPLDKTYVSYLKKISKNKNITFVERPTDEKMVQLYRNASCFVLPVTTTDYLERKWKKSGLYALVAVEAMSCGTPIIVSDVGALPDFVEDNKNGFIFHDRDVSDLRAKIEKIIENKELALQMGETCRKLVEEKYNWEKIAKNVRQIYSNYLVR